MARCIGILLLLSLALSPAANAAPERVSPGWHGSLSSAWAWLFSWVPAIWTTAEKLGGMIIPDGSPPVESTSERSSAWITPEGFSGGSQVGSASGRSSAWITPEGFTGNSATPGRWPEREHGIR